MPKVALITAYNGQGQLLVGKRNDNERYTLPGGHLEEGEDPAAGALRELYEETGLHAQSLSFLKHFVTKAGVELHCFSAFVTGEPHGKNDPDHEVSKWEFIDVEEGLPPKVFNHLHGPQDDDNLVTQLFDLQKAEDAYQRVWHSNDNEIHIPSETHPDRPAYDENHLNDVRKTYGMDVRPLKVGTEQVTTTLPLSNRDRHDLYRRMFRAGERLPPIVVEKTASGYRVLDGNHKVHAVRSEGGGQMDAVELVPDQMDPELRAAHMEKAELAKGSLQARMRFNPDNVDENDEYATALWQGPMREHDSRDNVPYMGGNERSRALMRLSAGTPTRRGASGEVEYMLHRGMGPVEKAATHQTPGFVEHADSMSSWTPRFSTARSFGMDYARAHEPYSHVVSAWVPESAIHSIPKQYGSVTTSTRPYEEAPKKRGENEYTFEHEVVVGPHKSQLAQPHEVPGHPQYKRTIHDMVNRRTSTINSKGRVPRETAHFQHQIGTLKRSEGDLLKAEDEVYRLLDHPHVAERTMALKLDSLKPDHLDTAALDADPKVYSAAIDHPKFGPLQGLHLMEATQDKSGAFPSKQKNVFLLRSSKIRPYHLAAYLHSAQTAGPDEHRAAVSMLVSPDMPTPDALLRKIYLNSDTDQALRIGAVAHPSAPADVLDHALDLGLMLQTQDAAAMAFHAVAHKNVLRSSLGKLVHRAADRGEGPVVQLACHALKSNTVPDEVGKYLMTQSIAKPASEAPRLLGALLSGPSGTKELADEAQKHLQPQALQHIVGSPHAGADAVGAVVASGDPAMLSKAMESPHFGNEHLALLVKLGADALAKNFDENAKALAQHPVVATQLGFDESNHPAFKAAKFLAMGQDITDEDQRSALYNEDGDVERAALLAYGLPCTDDNLAALRAVMEVREVKKGELDGSVPVANAVTAHPEGKDVGDAIERAVKDNFVFPVALGGKHSAGSMLAYDDETRTTWLLKSGSGGAGGAAGSKQDPSNPNSREAAFYYVAKEWGIEKWFPRAELLLLDGQPFAALALLPLNYKTLDKREQEDHGVARRVLHPYLHDGTLHQWAVIDYVLGNPDRHGQNVMVNPKYDVRLIDHGSAFAGDLFDPAHDHNSFVPYYLRAWHLEGSFNQLPSDQKLRGLPRVHEEVAAKLTAWIDSIDAGKLTELCKRYGINSEPTLTRLGRLQVAVASEPADLAINKLWVTT